MKTLKEYAKERGITYQTAWNRAKAGKIKGAVKDEFGRIWVPDESQPVYTEIASGDSDRAAK